MAWTLSNVGGSEGASSGDRHKPDGQIDFAPDFKNARQAVPTNGPDGCRGDMTDLATARVVVPDSTPSGQFDIDLGSVAPDTDAGVSHDLDGMESGGHGGFVLGANRPD